jgi:molybdate transport system regulatory protein
MQQRQQLHPSFKIWLSVKGGDLIGKGGVSLLKLIEKHGSIRKAAKELGCSYMFAWVQLEEMERKLGTPVVLTKRGGTTGGGAELTNTARVLLDKYDKIEKSVRKVIREETI